MGAPPDGRHLPRLPHRWRPTRPIGLLLGCLVLLLCAPAAFAAEGGAISGTVTAAVSGEPLRGIEVTVYEAGDEGFPVGFATTKSDGRYTVEGLPGGYYVVEFSAGFEGEGGNYAPQYYRDAVSPTSANRVPVSTGSTTGEIDAAMEAGGEIKGTVTEAGASETPLRGIQVVVYEGKEAIAFATTGEHGEYSVIGLRGGSYKVGFSAGFEGVSELEELPARGDFIEQFYNDKPTLAAAETVVVSQGGPASENIDARMQRGAEIEGTVIDASTKAPVSGVLVGAIGSGETVSGAGFTNASGHYTIAGLPTGSYEVEFFDPTLYVNQYYDDQSTLASANPVSALAPEVTAGIDAALVPRAPVNASVPVASGTASVGHALSCAPGSWTGSPTPTFAYAWLRDGVAIPGAVSSTYVVQNADEGNGLTCKVTASNKYGSVAAVSNTLIVPVPSPPPPVVKPPVLSLPDAKIVVHGDTAHVTVTCADATCAGTIQLTARLATHRGRRRHGRVETVLLARASYELAAGDRKTVVLRLTSTGMRALAGASHGRLSATANGTVAGGSAVRRTVQLSLAPHRR